MKKKTLKLLSFVSASVLFLNVALAQTFPQGKTYSNGLSPTNKNGQDAQNNYNTWKSNFVTACSNGRYRVKFDDPNQTVSEGIGYGMLLSAYAGDKTVFDGLWLYYKDFRNSHGVMHWKIGGCSGIVGSNGATDSEVDAAMALIVANSKWGTYAADAKALIAAIKSFEIDGSSVLKPGDMFGGSALTNPSYFAPGYFRAFGSFTNDAAFWNGVASKCYQIINSNLSVNGAKGGLVSDWCTSSGSYSSSASGYYDGGKRYHYDAARTPWRIAVDYVWSGSADAQSYCLKASDFVRVTLGGPKNVKDGYFQNGTAYGQWHNSTFAGAFAAASMGGGNQTHLNASYSDLVSINDAGSYFNQTLKTLYLFLLTGNFYNPGTSVNPPANIPPTTSITSPANGASFTSGTSINIAANASDSDGSISKVEFFAGATKVGEDVSAPYSCSWTNVQVGNYSITSKATDNAGAVTTSSSVSVTVTSSVIVGVNITSPANNAVFSAGANVTITANASSNNGSISKVEFFQGNVKLGEDLTSPYSLTWNNVSAGTYSLKVQATSGSTTTVSSPVNITVNAPQPNPQSSFSGSPWTIPGLIQAENYDNGGSGVAFNDNTSGNAGGAYRSDNVDIESCGDVGGGYNVGWIDAGEWLEYTVNVQTSGAYNFNFRVASPNSLKKFHIEMNGVNVTNSITVPQTGNWYSWTSVYVNSINLAAGTQIMRVYMETDGFNLNSIQITKSNSPRLATGIENTTLSGNIVLFPNPVSDNVTLDLGNEFTEGLDIEISNLLGQSVVKESVRESRQVFNTSTLENGIYLFNLYSEGKVILRKKIIKH